MGAREDWAGFYNDPEHPGCKRLVIMQDTTKALINGRDRVDGKKCKRLGTVEQSFSLKGIVKSEGSDEMVIDFSPKGGPPDLVGKFVDNGILFPDGNKWTKLTPE